MIESEVNEIVVPKMTRSDSTTTQHLSLKDHCPGYSASMLLRSERRREVPVVPVGTRGRPWVSRLPPRQEEEEEQVPGRQGLEEKPPTSPATLFGPSRCVSTYLPGVFHETTNDH